MTLQDQYNIKKFEYYAGNRPEMQKFLPKKIDKFLDVGCGFGAFLSLIKNEYKSETWGIEPFQSEAEKTKNIVDNLIISSIEESILQLPENYFDVISFNDVIEHLLDPEDVLKKLMPKLSKNGTIIASIPNILYFPVFIRDIFLKQDWKYEDSGILDKTHLRFFTKKSIIRLFEGIGYEVVKIEGINSGKSWKFNSFFNIFNVLTLGRFWDMKYLQFAVVAKPKKQT